MIGIYFIKCTINKKVYIGSSINIDSRLKRHVWYLKKNQHPNQYFQNIYNKYGIENLKFGIIELCDEEILFKREQYYIDNNKNLINIVTTDIKRLTHNKEICKKISKKLTEMFKNGEIERYNSGSFKKGSEPWNKGKKYKSTDHLKVPKTNTKKLVESRKLVTEKKRENNYPEIEVYDSNNNIVGRYRSAADLRDLSLNENFELIPYMNLRNKKGRNGYSPYLLQTVNILISAKNNKSYKGLFFKLLP